MTSKPVKPQPVVTLSLKPGPLTPAMRVAGKKFWARLIIQAKAEAKGRLQNE